MFERECQLSDAEAEDVKNVKYDIECRYFTEHLNMVVGFIMISYKCLILLALGLSTFLYAVHLLDTLQYGTMIYRDIIDHNHQLVICS